MQGVTTTAYMERLFHFVCPYCNHPFTMSDVLRERVVSRPWSCPACHQEFAVSDVEEAV